VAPGKKLTGIHTGAAAETGVNEATDLTVLFPNKGPRKESPNWSTDDLEVDPDANPNSIVRTLSDKFAPVTYFEDSEGRIGLTERNLFVDAKGRQWADITDDDDDDEPLIFRSREQWEAERIERDNEIMDNMEDGQGGSFQSNAQKRLMNRLLKESGTACPPDIGAKQEAPRESSPQTPEKDAGKPNTSSEETNKSPAESPIPKKKKKRATKKSSKQADKISKPADVVEPAKEKSDGSLTFDEAIKALSDELDACFVRRDLPGAMAVEAALAKMRKLQASTRTGAKFSLKVEPQDFRKGTQQ